MIERQDLDAVSVLRLAHGKANALDVELADGLRAELAAMAEADEPRAVVLTGGGTMFSAGVDLKRVVAGGAGYVAEFLPAFGAMLEELFHYPKPVVAAVNGHAIAGGCVLVCACDHRVAARGLGSRLGVPELLVGVPFPPLALEIVRFVVAPARLQEVVYSGRTLDVDQALACGLVDELVEEGGDGLVARAVEVARRLGAIEPTAFRLTKATLRAPVGERVARARASLDADIAAAWSSPQTLAAIERYVARTLGGKG